MNTYSQAPCLQRPELGEMAHKDPRHKPVQRTHCQVVVGWAWQHDRDGLAHLVDAEVSIESSNYSRDDGNWELMRQTGGDGDGDGDGAFGERCDMAVTSYRSAEGKK